MRVRACVCILRYEQREWRIITRLTQLSKTHISNHTPPPPTHPSLPPPPPHRFWGKGSYFAENSSYSLAYAHRREDSKEQMLLALVTKGKVDSRGGDIDRELRKPGKGCHSVEAVTGNSCICVLYETSARAYPT